MVFVFTERLFCVIITKDYYNYAVLRKVEICNKSAPEIWSGNGEKI